MRRRGRLLRARRVRAARPLRPLRLRPHVSDAGWLQGLQPFGRDRPVRPATDSVAGSQPAAAPVAGPAPW